VRAIDCETHPILPAGVAAAYAMGYESPDEFRRATSAVAAEAIRIGQFESFIDDLLVEMDRFDIEKSLIMRGALATPNDDLAAAVEAHPDRLIAFASWGLAEIDLDPPRESAAALEELDRALGSPAFVGVGEVSLPRRFAPHLDPPAAAEAFRPVLEVCRRHQCPIMFHTGDAGPSNQYAYRDPALLEPLIAAFPDVPFMVGHIGGHDREYFQHAMALATAYSNVHLTASVTEPAFVREAVDRVGAGRVIFGSDWSASRRVVEEPGSASVTAQEHAFATIRSAQLSDEDRERVLSANILELLRI
jgi:predicted TIM-barrel fold metal-dependent hydrolase